MGATILSLQKPASAGKFRNVIRELTDMQPDSGAATCMHVLAEHQKQPKIVFISEPPKHASPMPRTYQPPMCTEFMHLGACRCEGDPTHRLEAEQVQKCSAAAQNIFARAGRLPVQPAARRNELRSDVLPTSMAASTCKLRRSRPIVATARILSVRRYTAQAFDLSRSPTI